MPNKQNWTKICVAESADKRDEIEEFQGLAIVRVNHPNCTICPKTGATRHKMNVSYLNCTNENCSDGTCKCEGKILSCELSKSYVFYILNEHATPGSKCKQRGLTNAVKELIENIIHTKNITKPSLLRHQLVLRRVNPIPELKSIQNYISYRRSLLGDTNLVDDVAKYVEEKRKLCALKEVIENDEVIYFGEDLNDGSDDSHFHLGFTSKALLDRLKDGFMYHIDATYKVLILTSSTHCLSVLTASFYFRL
jgi:hypothetical protein